MDKTTEQMIQDKGLTAPRITPADIDAAIKRYFFVNAGEVACVFDQSVPRDGPAPESFALLTLCIVELHNGFTIVGKSACASPVNYDREVGQKVALEDAKRQMWPLLGYALRDQLERGRFNPNGAVVPQ
jgi:hypothetical protein